MFNYLFYRSYKIQQKVGHSDDPAFFAALTIAFSIIIYAIDLIMLTSLLFGINFPLFGNKLVSGVLSAIIITFYYFHLLHKKKYLKILEKYESENSSKQLFGNIIIIIYFLLAFVLFVLGMYLKMLQNQGRF
ncbi:MAG: hypothetical protein KJ578_11405 [Bacteroidetes bacterium]|nr:hypothetical protein [Bacteroidota bacterium]MBU1580792.1 hypothetical protein [Bacteroidota bacterium]MBU2558375.1 hypothetical protein [Bacteroidota bacterium]